MPKPNLLILIDWYLPGYRAGGPIQSIRNLVGALKATFEISIITKNVDHADSTPYEGIPANEWTSGPDGSRVFYFSNDHLTYSNLSQVLEKETFDYLYLNNIFSIPFTIWPLWKYRWQSPPGKLILAPRGMLKPVAVKSKRWKKGPYLFLLKLSGMMKKVRWHATNADEASYVRRIFPRAQDIRIAANLPKSYQMEWKPTHKLPGKVSFVFSSRISREKKLDFFLARLTSVSGEVQVDIFGHPEDLEVYQRCQKIAASLPSKVRVHFHGGIPGDDLPKEISSRHFSVLASEGENFGHAIFEGMLAGNPVLISDRTPWRDLSEKQVGWDLPLEDPAQFEDKIQLCIDMDQEMYQEWSRSAWTFAKAFKESPQLIQQIHAIFSA